MIEAEARALGLSTATRTFLLATGVRPEHEPIVLGSVVERLGSRIVLDDGLGVIGGVFDEATDAIGAALDVQGAGDGVAAVRMAVHTGEVILAVGDAGPTLDRGLALVAIARPGQVLISATSADIVALRLPADAALVDCGPRCLQDLGGPEHVWQLSGAAAELAPLRSLETARHNLPAQLTPLIGRGADVADVARLIGGQRLVTLVGPGGVGKTRLAIASAAATLERCSGGVWWVELAGVTTAGGVGRAALAVLGTAESRGVAAAVQLAAVLGDEPALLVLDNCEHLVEECAGLVAGLLVANPAATVLATSREPLGVPGEVTWRVPSLTGPTPAGEIDGATLYRCAATRLFVDRALRARPKLIVDDDGRRDITEICDRLDGIPLAIELAAARCRHLVTSQISRELDDRFRLLTGGSRTSVARHQTLALSIAWSYDRLDDVEQRTFRRLGVFVGPFPLDAAQAVVSGAGDIAVDAVFDVITRLVDKSMVVGEVDGRGEPRYRLLETLRVFAVERAAAAGETEDGRALHARWWATWLDRHFDDLHTDAMTERVDEVHDDLVAALEWSAGDPKLGLFLLGRLARSWWAFGRAGDAMRAIDQLLTPENATAHPRAWVEAANFAYALVYWFRSREEGNAFGDRIERVAETIDDDYQLTLARWLNGATHLHDRVRSLAHEREDIFVEAMAVIDQSTLLVNEDPQHAAAHLSDAHAIARAARSGFLREGVDADEAHVARDIGDLARGVALAAELATSRSNMNVSTAVWLLGSIGLLATDEDALRLAVEVAQRRLPNLPGSNAEVDQARARLRALTEGERAQVAPDFETILWRNGSLWFVCREAIDAGEPDRAVTLARAQARPTASGRAVIAALEGAVGGDEARWHEALRLAVECGLRPIAVDALEGLAVAAASREHWVDCRRLFAAADRLRDETGYRWRFCFEREVVEPARTAVIAALGADARQIGEGALEWRAAAAYAARSRGRRQRPRHGWASLTPTERQVAELVAEGQSNPQIATRLLMGRATVKTHLEHMLTKLGVSSRAELAAIVVRHSPT